MKHRERAALALAATASVVALCILVWRVRRGIDFTDESYYLAIPMRFALGDRPFIDELNGGQTAGLVIYPLVKLHMLVRGTTGIFWFIRLLYVVLLVGVGASAYHLARKKLPAHAAVLAGAACVPFVPYGAPALSYNTLGFGFLGIGLFLIARALLDDPHPRREVTKIWRDPRYWAGFCLGVAAFAYPTMLVCAVIATVAVLLLSRHDRIRSTLRTALGGASFILVLSPMLLRAGLHNIRGSLAYSAGEMAVTSARFPILWRTFLGQHPEFVMTFGAVALAVALSRVLPRTVALLLPGVAFLAQDTATTGTMISLGFISSMAMLAPVFGFALKDTRFGVTVLVAAWLPSAFAGAIVAWSSGNGAVASGVGLYPAAIASVVLMTAWIHELTQTIPFATVRLAFGFAPLAPLYVMVKLMVADEAVYRDAPLPQLTARISEGPFKDLLTSQSRRTSLKATSEYLLSVATTKRALFYYDFPAGYLITQTRPLVPSVWLFPMANRIPTDAHMFSERAEPGDPVFHLGASLDPTNNLLDRAVLARTSPLGYHHQFSVYVVK